MVRGFQVSKLAALCRPGVGGSFTYGVIFSLGTSAAPLLLLSVAAATANPFYGFLLALSFGIGRGLPFLVASLFAGAVTKFAQLTAFTFLPASLSLLRTIRLTKTLTLQKVRQGIAG